MSPRYISQESLDARENDILNHALKIIEKKGIGLLTMDKLVASVSYSKGTVYNHFSCKEDVFTALCNRNMSVLVDLFVRAASVDASARHKMLAISFAYLLSVVLTPQSYLLMTNAKTEIFDKASPQRSEEHQHLDDKLFRTCAGIVEEAIAKQELVLDSGVSVDDVSLSFYAMTFGTIGLLLKKDRTCGAPASAILEDKVIAHINIVMNGFCWAKPEQSQQAFLEHLKADVFADEIAILHKRGTDLQTGI